MKMKTTMRNNDMPIPMTSVKNDWPYQVWREWKGTWTLLYTSDVKKKMIQPLLEQFIRVFIFKISINQPYDPVILLLGIYSREKKGNIYPHEDLYMRS